MDAVVITAEERNVIEKLGHPLYTCEFLEEWINRSDNVFVNAPAALQIMGAHGFMRAVRCIVEQGGIS